MRRLIRLIKLLFYTVAAVALIVIGGAYFLPAETVVTRTAEIAAPQDKVFAIVGDFRRFQEYSPWAELDPKTKYTFEGPAVGLGQKMGWSSTNEDVGTGSQIITEYDPPRHVAADIAFGEIGHATTSWDLAPSTAGTTATWSFRTKLQGIPEKWFGLLFGYWIGADYEKGLTKLKEVAEAEAAGPAPAPGPAEPAATPSPEAEAHPPAEGTPAAEPSPAMAPADAHGDTPPAEDQH